MNVGLQYGMTTYPPSTGGTVHGYQLVHQLASRGHKIMTCYYDHGPHPDIEHFRGRRLAQFVRRIDVLYVRVDWRMRSVETSILKRLRLRRLPVVWEFNGTPTELMHDLSGAADVDRINRRLRRWAHLCDAAVAVSDDVADYVRREVGIFEVHVIPNGSDPAAFRPMPRAPDETGRPLNVVWIGTSSAGWHDLSTLLGAARLLNNADAHVVFTIYGDSRALPSDLPANVRVAGVVPYAELGSHLQSADVGVHLFRTDASKANVVGSPLKLFDYMACGLAVITNCEGQQSEIIASYQSGVKCDGTAEDLARWILQLEQHRDSCRTMGRNGRRAVDERFNWSNVGSQTETLLRNLVGARSS